MQLVIPNSFSPNTVALSGLVDANFTQVATIVNSGIDYGNINTTSGTTPGLIASQFLPTTTAQGTFSATTTGIGYTFLAGSTTAVPLAITGVSSQNADLFDVNLVAAGTKVFKIDKIGQGSFTSGATGSTPLAVNMIASQSVDGLQVNGAASITGNIFATYATAGGTLLAYIDNIGFFHPANLANASLPNAPGIKASSSTGNLDLNTGSGNAVRFYAGSAAAATLANLSTSGLTIAPTINSVNTQGYVPPVYTNAGAATASTLHIVTGSYVGTGSAVTITLSGAAVFSSQLSYTVNGQVYTTSTGVNTNVFEASNLSASSFQSIGTFANTSTIVWYAIGT